MEALKNALLIDPENEEGLNRYWFCTELTGNYKESVAFHEELIEMSPYSFLAWFNLGHALAGLQEYEKSLEAFSYVMAIDETFDAAYICSGDILYNMGKYEESIQFYHDAIAFQNPTKSYTLKQPSVMKKWGTCRNRAATCANR